jgi:enoyl-[acyl-carrier protein] reductase II
MIKTRLTDLLCIQHPIIQGGMAWVADAHLAAAVSNAGGLGIIASGSMPPELLRQEIRLCRTLTDKPFGVNLILMAPETEERVRVVAQERVPVATTGAGNPGKYIPAFKEGGCLVLPVIPSVTLARRVEERGADAVIIEGTEAGGHIGEITTMVLLPQVVDAVEVPVIAAGGIADGRGLAAALVLGAEGIQMGTRFVATKECTVHERYKEMIVKARDRDTLVTGRSTGHPVRVLKNKLAQLFMKLEASGAPLEELEMLGVGKLRIASREGDIDNGSVMAGQIAGMIKDIPTVAEVMERTLRQAEEILMNLGPRIVREG